MREGEGDTEERRGDRDLVPKTSTVSPLLSPFFPSCPAILPTRKHPGRTLKAEARSKKPEERLRALLFWLLASDFWVPASFSHKG